MEFWTLATKNLLWPVHPRYEEGEPCTWGNVQAGNYPEYPSYFVAMPREEALACAEANTADGVVAVPLKIAVRAQHEYNVRVAQNRVEDIEQRWK